MINLFWRSLTIQLLLLFFGPSVYAETMGQPTEHGHPAIYLDVDIDGKILEVDMLRKSARRIGNLSGIQSESFVYQWGFSSADREFALLLFLDVAEPRNSRRKVYVFSRKDGTIQESPITIDSNGDGRTLPLNSSSVFVSTYDFENKEMKRMIYNPDTNRVQGSFSFRIDGYTIHSDIGSGNRIYMAQTLGGSVVRKVDFMTGAVEQEVDVINLLRTDEPDTGRNVWIRALYENHALVKRVYEETEETRLYLIDADSKRVVAKSESLPNFYGRFLLYADEKDNLTVACIENIVVESKLKAAGILRNFVIKGGSITPGKSETFNPESQIVVTDDSGAPVVIPRYRFDYLSMREVQRQIFRRLPTAALGVIEARRRVRDEVIEEFNNPEAEGFTSRTLTHLEIR